MKRRSESRLSSGEIRAITKSYQEEFPTWRIARNNSLLRECAPFVQGISFERLSGGDYRAIGYLRVLAAPADAWYMELSQHLRAIPYVKRAQHEMKKELVCRAIRSEFVPSVELPFKAEEALCFYEKMAEPTSFEAYSLACANAYLGYIERAEYWCAEFVSLVNLERKDWLDFDLKRKTFLVQLQGWLNRKEAREHLERVYQEERNKWGIT